MRYSTLIVPIALLAIPATANAAGCQPAFVGADQTVMVDGVDIGSLNSAVRDFSVRVQNKPGPSGQPGAMDAAPCGATIRTARVGASSNPAPPPYRLSAPGTGQIDNPPDRKRVVVGACIVVRVHSSGRRIIKKKTQKPKHA